jgi:hypothetical protein
VGVSSTVEFDRTEKDEFGVRYPVMIDVTTARRFVQGLPVEILPLPHKSKTINLHSGPVEGRVRRVLPTAATMARRIAPWVTIVFAPKIYGPVADAEGLELQLIDGTQCMQWAGYYSDHTVYLAMSDTGPISLLSMVAHECWHALEPRLPRELIDHVDSMIDAPAWTHGTYWESRYEVRARAFEAWCGRMFAGMPAPTSFRRLEDPKTLDEIFGEAWDGELGQALMTEERVTA